MPLPLSTTALVIGAALTGVNDIAAVVFLGAGLLNEGLRAIFSRARDI